MSTEKGRIHAADGSSVSREVDVMAVVNVTDWCSCAVVEVGAAIAASSDAVRVAIASGLRSCR